MATSGIELHRAHTLHQLRSFRIASVLRMGVVALMLTAMLVGTDRAEWAKQTVLLGVYAFAALWALMSALPTVRQSVVRRPQSVAFVIVDVLALTGFQLLSTGGQVPLLVMTLLPILLGLDSSWRRAVVLLACSVVAFTVAVLQDPVLVNEIGWPRTAFRFGLYGFFCCTALMAVRVEQRHADTVAGLTALREELLVETMTASETLQRRISESIHDGPLQDVLVARQELIESVTKAPDDEHVDRALACLQDASERLREATFELHPAVLGEVGLGAAVEQLVLVTAHRSGITITADIDYPARSTIDPIAFGVVRELLSNVVRHSRAIHASVTLGLADQKCRLDVVDNGIGITNQSMARRLGQGHIGLASHRTRVEAAGGRFTFLDVPVGTHVRVEIPLPSGTTASD